MLLATLDRDGPQLYLIDPAGTSYVRYPDSVTYVVQLFVAYLQPAAFYKAYIRHPCIASHSAATSQQQQHCTLSHIQESMHNHTLFVVPHTLPCHHLRSSTMKSTLLYLTRANVNPQRYFGAAVGKGRQSAKTSIERLKLQDLTCAEGVKEIAKM